MKGYTALFIGFGTLLLILITVFVLIDQANPAKGTIIANSLEKLFGSIR